MGIKKIITSCISGPEERQEVVFKDDSELVQKIRQKEITLEDLKALKKVSNKKLFLEDVQYMISRDKLHELNKKIMEHALDLSPKQDKDFLLREGNDIFHQLLYLDAINDNFKVAIDEEKNIKFNLPKNILELFQVLTINFYKKNFENVELPKIEDKEDTIKVTLEREYIKKGLARSIMWLFVMKFIKDEYVYKIDDTAEKLASVKLLGSLNAKGSNYIKKLEDKGIIYLLGYPTYDEVIIGDEIEILGNQ